MQSWSFNEFHQLLSDLDVLYHDVHSNERFFIELVLHQPSAHRQSPEVRFHIVEASHKNFLPVLFSGIATPICDGLYEISAVPDWSIAQDLCVIVEHDGTFLPIARLTVDKTRKPKTDPCSFICLQHPDPDSKSILIGPREHRAHGSDTAIFTPSFVHWRSQCIPLAPGLFFEGQCFGFERAEQSGTWVSAFEFSSNQAKHYERVNVTCGVFDVAFDICVRRLHCVGKVPRI